VTKLAGEALLHAYWASYRLPVVGLRYFTVYGPRQRPDMGIHSFFEAARAGTPVKVYGTGAQTRDFTFVDDAVADPASGCAATNHHHDGLVLHLVCDLPIAEIDRCW
jgi:UDP-glucose 4-epimerase